MVGFGKVNCAILGSRGLVAQRYIQRLINHNWFLPVMVIGSESTVGKKITDLPWFLDEKKPPLLDITVESLDDVEILIKNLRNKNVQIIFSAIPDSIAANIDFKLAMAGFNVISHSSIHRLNDNIPLIVPDVNPNLLNSLDHQIFTSGSLISCSNCMVMPLSLALKPVFSEFNCKSVKITTQQSLSGGGRKLLSLGRKGHNINSFISGERESIINELNRILCLDIHNEKSKLTMEVDCSRVSRDYGHSANVEIIFQEDISEKKIIDLWSQYTNKTQKLKLPSAPTESFVFIDGEIDTNSHRWVGSDSRNPSSDLCSAMSIAIGEIEVTDNKLKFKLASENTIKIIILH
jgi:aspartate-semialdehyde dehydrogenase